MNASFDPFYALTKVNEGGFDLTPSDPGNWTGGAVGKGQLRGTNTGIAAASFPTLDIKNLTDDQIKFIYDTNYVDNVGVGYNPQVVTVSSLSRDESGAKSNRVA